MDTELPGIAGFKTERILQPPLWGLHLHPGVLPPRDPHPLCSQPSCAPHSTPQPAPVGKDVAGSPLSSERGFSPALHPGRHSWMLHSWGEHSWSQPGFTEFSLTRFEGEIGKADTREALSQARSTPPPPPPPQGPRGGGTARGHPPSWPCSPEDAAHRGSSPVASSFSSSLSAVSSSQS